MATQVVEIDHVLNPWQQYLSDATPQNGVWVCHRGLGKTTGLARKIVEEVLDSEDGMGKGLYIAPYLSQARKIAWDIFKDLGNKIPGAKLNENEMRITLPPSKSIWLLGADNPDTIRGHHPEIAVVDEAADVNPDVWKKILIPASWRKHMKMIFGGTPKGKNNLLHEVYEHALEEMKRGNPDWFGCLVPASRSGLISGHVLDDAKRMMGEEAYLQEFECRFYDVVVGAYYIKLLNTLRDQGKLVYKPLYRPELPVYTGWDLGMGTHLTIWFAQVLPDYSGVHIFDYHENPPGEGLEYAAEQVRSKPYRYAEHYLPHDLKQPESYRGKSRFELLKQALGPSMREELDRIPIEDGIQAVRSVLPLCTFDLSATDKSDFKGGFKALSHYRCEWVEKKNVFKSQPYKDWTEHAADGFRALCQGLSLRAKVALPSFSVANYDPLGQYLKEHMKKPDDFADGDYDELGNSDA